LAFEAEPRFLSCQQCSRKGFLNLAQAGAHFNPRHFQKIEASRRKTAKL